MIVSWMTTNRCNLTCKHCYQDASPDACADELTTDEARTLIDQIARAGFKVMIFSGGEPLMRPDIYELVSHAAGRGLRPVFGTNGTLITPDVARRLKGAGACAMGISLDSIDPARHDAFRGLAGAFGATVVGMRACREAGLPFQVHTTVMDWNQDEVCAITDFAVEEGAIAHYIFFLVSVGRGASIEDEALAVMDNERLLRDIMLKQLEVPIDVKPTCAPQFMRVADQLGVPVERPKTIETTALGAAFLAGLGTGFWKSTDELHQTWTLDRRFEPRGDRDTADAAHRRWRDAVERAKGWAV